MDVFKENYDRLNPEQRKAVDDIDGPLLVLAGPGTGKTQLLSMRAANLILRGITSPERMLILTFTNAAARAMRERLAQIAGNSGYGVEVETFHSFANSIVLESEGAVGYVRDKIEITEVEKVRAIEYILDNVRGAEPLRPFGSPYRHRNEIETRISELKQEGISPVRFREEVRSLSSGGPVLEEKHVLRLQALAAIYEKYEKLKDEDAAEIFDERGRIDYDDMILIALKALREEKALSEEFRARYDHVMVDEYQDTSRVQLELLFSILPVKSPNIMCVGDDDQAIYRFQGATLSNFRELRERLPGLKTISLKDNYRSTPLVLDVSSRIIEQLPQGERMAVKDLKSCRDYSDTDIRYVEFLAPEEERAFLVDEIRRHADIIKRDRALTGEERARPYNQIAVLVRKRSQIQDVIGTFLEAGIPYATDGKEDIRGEKRVRQLLNVLELAHVNTDDNDTKSLALYKMLTADYVGASQSDILRFIGFVNRERLASRGRGNAGDASSGLYQKFTEHFFRFSRKDDNGSPCRPSPEESARLEISSRLALERPHALHVAAWSLFRAVTDAGTRPVHDILMGYIRDAGIYGFILRRYEKNRVLRVRDLRAIVSFVNMVKTSDTSDPALGLDEFMAELDLREIHGMPLRGMMATQSQDGVRVYTVHSAKGLEFYSVFMPFCLQYKSWPLRSKPDVVPLPSEIYRSKEKVEEVSRIKELDMFDEFRLFYVASTRARARLVYTATPGDKLIASPFIRHLGLDTTQGTPADEEVFLAKFLSSNRCGDGMEGTEDVLKDIVAGLTLNPTSLNNYISCRRKFLYDNVLMLPGRKNQHLVFGNCAHKALEEVYREFMEKGVFPPFDLFKSAFMSELEYQGISDEIKRWCLDRMRTLKEWYDAESVKPVMPVDLENKIEIPMGKGLFFRGTFDKIEENPDGTLRVVDYKTGKPDKHVKAIVNCRDLAAYECDDYYRQLIAYKMLYETSGRGGKTGRVSTGLLQFLDPAGKTVKKYGLEKGRYHNEIVELTQDQVSSLEGVIKKCWNDIQDLRFEKLPERDGKERCARCPFDDICWG